MSVLFVYHEKTKNEMFISSCQTQIRKGRPLKLFANSDHLQYILQLTSSNTVACKETQLFGLFLYELDIFTRHKKIKSCLESPFFFSIAYISVKFISMIFSTKKFAHFGVRSHQTFNFHFAILK